VPRLAPLLLVALLSTAAACGDDGPDATGTEPAATTTPATTAPSTPAEPSESTVPAEPSVPAEPVAPTGVVVEVVALDNSFRPEVLEIAAGDEVVFVNRGRNEHDALSVEGEGWGVEVEDFQPGDEYRHVFDTPGTYRYYCSIHGTTEVGMVGTVIVTG
jgi:plastocyanin